LTDCRNKDITATFFPLLLQLNSFIKNEQGRERSGREEMREEMQFISWLAQYLAHFYNQRAAFYFVI
jgi:hypothetical protein